MTANPAHRLNPKESDRLQAIGSLRQVLTAFFAGIALAATVLLPAYADEAASAPSAPTASGEGFEYFFATPSLSITSATDFDLTGLSFIEGVEGGFRVGSSFVLDWQVMHSSALSSGPEGTWTGSDTSPRTLSIGSGGDLSLGSARLSLNGGTIALNAQGALSFGDGAVVDAGSAGTGGTGGGGGSVWITVGGDPLPPLPGSVVISGGGIRFDTAGGFPLFGGGGFLVLSPVPEPSAAMSMLAGMLLLTTLYVRRRYPPK